ncbi:LPS assembly lipoprotein LptE [Bosea sp. RAF48]|uniref:LPS assembly lipoprotein LptE n=1 Tax=Bosea sp. RAF48 TaxID=3237480 RepID=UPI003F8F0C21
MSSSEAVLPRRALLAAAFVAAALAGGCFQPLYSENTKSTVGGNVKTALRTIEIPEIKGLIGHYFRNELVFEFDGGGEPDAQRKLRLEANIAESVEVVTVDYINGRADSAVLVATATWKVTRIGTGEVVSSGTNSVRAPYERSGQRFATVRAARDAQIRAAKNLATIIRGQIAADLTS